MIPTSTPTTPTDPTAAVVQGAWYPTDLADSLAERTRDDCAECGELILDGEAHETCIADGDDRHADCHRAQCRETGCLDETQRTAVIA